MLIDLNKDYKDKRKEIRDLLRDICQQNKVDFANVPEGFTLAADWNTPNCAIRIYKIESENYKAVEGLPILILNLEEKDGRYETRLLREPNFKELENITINKKLEQVSNNMAEINLETVRGMRDFLPEDKILRDTVIEKIKKVFENYGFAPFDTPVLENTDLLMGKNQYGDEALKLVYEFTDKGGRQIGMRYDFTVPLARVVAMNPQLPKPFKGYRIDKVWRYERPQAGRYREFYQCDIDTVGVGSPMADAEIIACANAALKAIGFEKFIFRINSRNIMNELLEGAGVVKNQVTRTLRILDKKDKISEQELMNELRTFLSESSVDDLIGLMKLKGNWNIISSSLKICDENRKPVEEFLKYLKDFGITNFVFDLSSSRRSRFAFSRSDRTFSIFGLRKFPFQFSHQGCHRLVDGFIAIQEGLPLGSQTQPSLFPLFGILFSQ